MGISSSQNTNTYTNKKMKTSKDTKSNTTKQKNIEKNEKNEKNMTNITNITNITNKQNNNKMDDENNFNNDWLNNIVIEPNEPNEPNEQNEQNEPNGYIEPNEPFIMDEDDDIRTPISSTFGILLDDGTDDFIKFKKSILSDNTLDNDMKQILIKSRLDTIEKFESRSKFNIEKAFRVGIVSILIVKLKSNEYYKINIVQKEQVLKQIDKWIDGIIKTIKLDSEILYEINELIDEIKFMRVDFDDLKIKKIFEPKNQDDYICFVDIMEAIKVQSIKEEQERINKKLEQKRLEEEAEQKHLEEEEKKNNIIMVRKELVDVLILNLNKLCLIDKETKQLMKNIIIPINNYVGLITDYIEIQSDDILTQFVKFINSIRIAKDTKERIINLIKNSSI